MEFLKELFTEPLSFDAFQKAVADKGYKLADLSTGKYADVDKLKKATDDLKEAKETIGTLTREMQTLKNSKASAEDWEKKFNDLQKEIKDKEDAEKKAKEDAELTDAITAVFGDKTFTSDYVKNGIIADMKAEIAKPENKSKGYAEIFETLTKDKEGIFANPNPGVEIPGMGKGVDMSKISDDTARAVMGLAPKKE